MLKWYFACNEKSSGLFPLIEAAVNSALLNTSLKPHFVFDGEECDFTQKLREKGVKIIFHRVGFYDALKNHYDEQGLNIASGAFLRCDIPVIEQEDEFVLYTDCDAIFLKNFETEIKPKFFACAPQSEKHNFSHFNTGVMLMNVKKLRETHQEFCLFISQNLNLMPALDQSAYQIFYSGKNTKLPTKFNHKPYWGISKNVVILHFHGIKPTDFISENKFKNISYQSYKLYKKNIPAYDFYFNLFKNYSPRIEYDEKLVQKVNKGNYKISRAEISDFGLKIKARMVKFMVTIVNKIRNRAIFK